MNTDDETTKATGKLRAELVQLPVLLNDKAAAAEPGYFIKISGRNYGRDCVRLIAVTPKEVAVIYELTLFLSRRLAEKTQKEA